VLFLISSEITFEDFILSHPSSVSMRRTGPSFAHVEAKIVLPVGFAFFLLRIRIEVKKLKI